MNTKNVILLVTLLLAFLACSVYSQARFDFDWGDSVAAESPLLLNISFTQDNYLVWHFIDTTPHSVVATSTINGTYSPSQLVPGYDANNPNNYPFRSEATVGNPDGSVFFYALLPASSNSTPPGVYYFRDEFNSNLTGIITVVGTANTVAPVSTTPSTSLSTTNSAAAIQSISASIVASPAASVAASAVATSPSAAVFSPSAVATSPSSAAFSPVASASAASASASAAVSSIAASISASQSRAVTPSTLTTLTPSRALSLSLTPSRAPSGIATPTASPSPSGSCTRDTDGDGVPDCFDLCPRNKRKTAPTEPYGCRNTPRSSHTVIEFDFDILAPINCTELYD